MNNFFLFYIYKMAPNVFVTVGEIFDNPTFSNGEIGYSTDSGVSWIKSKNDLFDGGGVLV
jgi:hypothetical protein